jgi:hypothetical protein
MLDGKKTLKQSQEGGKDAEEAHKIADGTLFDLSMADILQFTSKIWNLEWGRQGQKIFLTIDNQSCSI